MSDMTKQQFFDKWKDNIANLVWNTQKGDSHLTVTASPTHGISVILNYLRKPNTKVQEDTRHTVMADFVRHADSLRNDFPELPSFSGGTGQVMASLWEAVVGMVSCDIVMSIDTPRLLSMTINVGDFINPGKCSYNGAILNGHNRPVVIGEYYVSFQNMDEILSRIKNDVFIIQSGIV